MHESRTAAAPSGTPPAKRRILTMVSALVAVAAIGVATYGSISSARAGSDGTTALTIVAPAAAGGGWDGFARSMQQAQRENRLVGSAQVVNVPGAGGTIALGNLKNLQGRSDIVMIGGTGLHAAEIQFESEASYKDITPLAVTVEEYGVIVVPADSPYQTLDELVEAWGENPGDVPWTGGGSFDRLVSTELAVKAGLDPTETNFIPSDGGADTIATLLNGTAAAAAGGYPDNIDQVESGRLRALALVAPEPIDGIDIPTTVEQGYDVTLTNWRLVAAPGGITPEDEERLTTLVLDTMETPQWKEAEKRFYWTERIITGDELDAFLDDEFERIADLYEELGQ